MLASIFTDQKGKLGPNSTGLPLRRVCSLLLSLKKRPVIRYQRNSEIAQRVAETVLGNMEVSYIYVNI